MSLPELQRAFAAGLAEARAAAIPGLLLAAHLEVHRNHRRSSLTDALAATFPAVRALVGEAFFAQAARRMIAVSPPTRPCLFEYGAEFPALLASLPETAPLPWLPDVARLEWLANLADHAPDMPVLAAEALARLPAGRWERARLALHPSCAVLRSAYPVSRIRAFARAEADAPDPAAGGEVLLVRRDGIDVVWRALDPVEAVLIERLLDGATLTDALDAALAVAEDGTAPARALAGLFSPSLVVGVDPDEDG